MESRTTWRWSSLLVVLAMILSMAAATVSAQPAPARPEVSSAAPAQQPPPPKPEIPPEVETSADAAFQKLAPDLRDRAKSPSGRPILVSVLMTKEVNLNSVMERVVYAKPLNGIRWAVGEVLDSNLKKLAGIPGVLSVISTETYQPVPAPGEEEFKPARPRLTGEQIRALLQKGGKDLLRQKLQEMRPTRPEIEKPDRPSAIPRGGIAPTTIKVRDIHGASAAHTKGYTGTGVVAAVVDTGVDFGHPDLQGTQARIPSGPYAGWPFAYNTLSGIYYALMGLTIGPDNYWDVYGYTWYAHTLPVEGATCTALTCTANLKIDYGSDAGWFWPPVTLTFIFSNTSKSDQYYYTVHPDYYHLEAGYYLGLGYASTYAAPAAVIVADETTAGVYDTVYVDVDFDQDLTTEKPMRKGDELAGADLYDAAGFPGTDGVWDLSAGILTWIADGNNPPPGVSALYDGVAVPQAGRLLSFVGDEDSHGTNCAGDIAAQGVITDPQWMGPINPLFAGGGDVGGVGGPVLAGMAPGAKVAAFQNGFSLPFDSWTLAALGFDGVANSGDEAQIVSNSWGASATINDGWDETSRFAHWLNRNYAPNTAFLVATGNGGHGYGTVTEPDGGSIIDVGASTSYGSLMYFEVVTPTQFTYGDVQPWSNRGPGTLGDVAPDVVAVGAWGTGANPLNLYGNGQAAYDIFGGTSMATPIAAGNLALVYQAFRETNGRWPTWQEAKGILLNSARDLGYDVLTQGSGNVDADRATDIAAGLNKGYWVEPAQWIAGNYRGAEYPAFPAIMHPGDTAVKTFTIHNTYAGTYSVNLSDAVLQRVHEITFTLSFPSFSPPPSTRPTWVTDITSLIDTYDPDLVRAQVVFPYSVFDTDYNYSYEDHWRVFFYDWTDLNGDGNLWTDTNGNGRVDAGEIDMVPDPVVGAIYEYNRFTYGYPYGTYLEASVGRDSLSRRHDGVFFGVQRRTGAEAVTLQVRITFYRKADWDWLSLSGSSVGLPASGDATFQATMSVPATARPGVYEGAIYVSGEVTQTIPVVVHVAANSPNFQFGAASLDEPLGDTPYDNGHLFGGFDWAWRYEAGDWKLFYYDIPDGTAGPGKAMIVDTHWINPVPPLFYEEFESWPPSGWSIINNTGDCVWESTATTGLINYTGGSGYAADADSDWCGDGTTMDTELRTPVLDLSGLTQAWLAFKSDFNDFGGLDDGYVDISTNGGTTWTNLLHYDGQDYRGPRTEIINLTPYVGSANVVIRFRYVAPGWDWWWEVDEVGIYEEEPVPPLPFLPTTDVDTWIYGAAPDFYSTSDPAFFGPQSVEQVGGSNNTNTSAGIFRFDTATGGPREVVAGELRDGLGFIALHNVLYAGTQFGEPVVGRAYQVQAAPSPVEMTTSRVVDPSPLQFGDSWVETFTTGYTITEGLDLLTYGLSQPQSWSNVNLPPASGTCDWSHTFSVANGGLIEATAWSTNIADIDLYLDGPVSASSTTPLAWEQVRVKRPPDGSYEVCVDNYTGSPGTFNLVLRVIQGSDLVVSGVPTGTINANTPVTFTVTFTKTAMPGTTWEGLLYLGPASAPTALEIPVTVHIITPTVLLNVDKSASTEWAQEGDVFTYTITVQNLGTDREFVTLSDPLPAKVEFVPGSQRASQGTLFLDIINGEARWADWVDGGGTVTMSFQVRASSGQGWVENTATINGTVSAQVVRDTARTFVNPFRIYLPLVVRNAGP